MNMEITKAVSKIEIDNIELENKVYNFIKRIIDIIGALIGCIILLPLIIGVWFANKVSNNKGPIIIAQKRIGKGGKPFKMYKFRSMVNDADKVLKQYLINNPDKNEEFIKYRKLTDDPRITPVGNFIRKTSIDEFPQFINILKGEMSLVGPRPYLFREKRAISEVYSEIIRVKPGLTGPWQISGRSKMTLENRMKLDAEYVKNCSIKNDAKYFLSTFSKLFIKGNAI